MTSQTTTQKHHFKLKKAFMNKSIAPTKSTDLSTFDYVWLPLTQNFPHCSHSLGLHSQYYHPDTPNYHYHLDTASSMHCQHFGLSPITPYP